MTNDSYLAFDSQTGELIVCTTDDVCNPDWITADQILQDGFFGGYMISSIGHLPIEDDMTFYIFVIGGACWSNSMNEVILDNFENLARQIGPSASIVKGLEEPFWSEEVIDKYFGKDHETMYHYLPALLITDAHPKRLNESSLRLLAPLRDLPNNFFDIDDFFNSLVRLVRYKDFSFLNRFKSSEVITKTGINPNFWGIEKNLDPLRSHHQARLDDRDMHNSQLFELLKQMADNSSRIINTSTYNEFGIVNAQNFVQGNYLDMGQDLAQAASQIQDLLNQLQKRGVAVDIAQEQVARDMANQAQKDSKMKETLVRWGRSLGNATVSDVVKGIVKLAIRSAGIPLP